MASITGTKPFGSRVDSIDDEYRKTEEIGYTLIVSLNPATETVDDALALAPVRGSALFGRPTVWLSRRTPRQISKRLVEIDLEFSQRPYGTPPPAESPNPTDWSPRWLGSSVEKISRVMYKDHAGAPVLMTNGEMYQNPVMEYVNIGVTRYRIYYPVVQPALDEYLLEWNNTINNASFRGKPAFTWLLAVSADPAQIENYEVASLTFEFRYNKLTWLEERLQYGSFYKSGANRIPFEFTNANAGFLSAAGGAGTLAAPHYVKHRGSYEEKDFNDLFA